LATPQASPRGGRAADPAAAQPSWDRRKWYILAAICVAQFMVVLDIAVVNVALPSIRTDLHFTNESLQWVLTAYAILFGGFLLLGGRLADRFGRRLIFMTGLCIFAGASLMCGLAWSEASLITFRAIQGFGGALLSPAALSVLATTFTEGRERNLALGIWGGIAGSGAAAGTLLGGVLTSAFGWQWIFFINVPIGAALVGLTPFLLVRERGDASIGRRGFDIAGAVTVTGGLMVLVYALTRATQIGWSATETVTLLVVSAVLLAAFTVIEIRAANPILPVRLLRLPVPRTANIVGLLVGGALFSQFFLLTLYMQQVLRYSAFRTGVAYVATTVTLVAVAIVAQAFVTRLGPRVVLVVGLLLTSASIYLYSRVPVHGSYVSDLLPAFLLAGVGLGLTFVPIQISSLTGVRDAEAGAASGLINTSQQIGGAVGLAAITTIATTVTTNYLKGHAPSALTAATGLVHGFRIAFLVLLGVTLVGAVLTATMLRGTTVAAGGVVEEPGAEPGEPAPAFSDLGTTDALPDEEERAA
jgi:EmrB/QacA subfamily drug resistance transporter